MPDRRVEGVNALLYLAIAAMLLLGSGAIGHRMATAELTAKFKDHLVSDARKAEEAEAKARLAEHQLATAQSAVAAAYEQGKQDAETEQQRVLDDLRSGALRLRRQWGSCETQRLSATAAAAAELDAARRDREDSAARIVRAAAQCDAQVSGLQDLLRAERAIQSKQ